jgi:hypothetical protein
MEKQIIEEAASQGAQLLDKLEPVWWKKINTDQLAMASGRTCILGQLYGEFVQGTKRLQHWRQSIECGFMLAWRSEMSEIYWTRRWNWLRDAWIQEIAARRGPTKSA